MASHQFITMAVFVALLEAACGGSPVYLRASEMSPSGSALGARAKLLATYPDGTREYGLVLVTGDEVATAVTDLAKREKLVAGRFTAIGAVRAARLGWFDPSRRAFRILDVPAQSEVVSLVGDIGVDEEEKPIVHAHCVLGDERGQTFGGHLVAATTSPNVEVFVTAFPRPFVKRYDAESDSRFFDPSR